VPIRMTALAQACEEVRRHLSASLGDRQQPNRVQIGNLADAAPATTSDPNRVNLLFYRVEPDGSTMGISDPARPWLVRLHLLITAFASEDDPSVGHNDLRLLGEVAAILHERPILDVIDVEGEAVRLDVVPEPLSVESLNQLWSVQGEVGFRPSLGYEVALVPIVSDTDPVVAPLVGEPLLSAAPFTSPPVAVGAPGRADLRLVGTDHPTFLSIARDDPALPGLVLQVWIRCPDLDRVELVWELLEGGGPWRRLAPAAGAGPHDVHGAAEPDPGDAHAVGLPADADLPAAGAYQLVLRALPPGADPGDRALDGRPVVLAVHEVAP
jgi:hypothetical protein